MSSRPHVHPHTLSEEIADAIVTMRLKHHKCGEVIHQELLNQGLSVSFSSVKRTLECQGLIRKRRGPCDTNRLYVYALIDVFSRWAHAKVYLRINTHHSLRFVKETLKMSGFSFSMLQPDHRSEFSSWFTEQVKVLGLAHRHSRVRKPSDNGNVKRFLRTLQEECLAKIPQTIKAYRREIPEYLQYYNNQRVHLSLNLTTPLQCVQAIG